MPCGGNVFAHLLLEIIHCLLLQIIACIWIAEIAWSLTDNDFCGLSLGTNFSEMRIIKQSNSFMKMHLKIPSVKWRPFSSGGVNRRVIKVLLWCWMYHIRRLLFFFIADTHGVYYVFWVYEIFFKIRFTIMNCELQQMNQSISSSYTCCRHVTWAPWLLKSAATWFFLYAIFQANN